MSKVIKFIIGFFVCFIALLLPYKFRLKYTRIIAFFVHLPFVIFGRTVRYFLTTLKINAKDIN